MTDKQIIIDGVDVSGCEFYNKDDKTCREVNGKYDTDICEFDKCENSNCYYKQHKRKEQECKKWKNAYEVKEDALAESEEYCEELEEKLKAIEQECKSLRNLLAEHNDVMKINELMMKEFGIEILKDITTDDITLRSIKLIKLKQECDMWKNLTIDNGAVALKYQQQLDQLKAENKDLQEQIRKHNDDMFKNPPEKRFYCKGCTLPYISKKLKQTLTEIKEIAEDESYIGFWDEQISEILQKISEVGNEN